MKQNIYSDMISYTQKRRPASITKGYTAAALFFLSQRVSESNRITFILKHAWTCMGLLEYTEENTYTSLLYKVIFTGIYVGA